MTGNGNREFGDIGARLKLAESEIANLRTKSHKHASEILANTMHVAGMKSLPYRVEKLEKWQYTIIGASMATGAIGAVVMELILKKL